MRSNFARKNVMVRKGLINPFQMGFDVLVGMVEDATAIVAPGTDCFTRLEPYTIADCFSHKQWLTRKAWMDKRSLERQARNSLLRKRPLPGLRVEAAKKRGTMMCRDQLGEASVQQGSSCTAFQPHIPPQPHSAPPPPPTTQSFPQPLFPTSPTRSTRSRSSNATTVVAIDQD